MGLLLLLVITIWTPHLTPYDPGEIHSSDQLLRVGYRYVLGTDFLGRDVLSRTLGGYRGELPKSGLIMILAGATGGLLMALGRYLSRGLWPRRLWPILRACLAVYHVLPSFLVIFCLFLIIEPAPWALEATLLLGLLPATLYLLSRPRPWLERLLSLARIGGEALLLLVIFHFLNVVPDAAHPTWGSELRMGMRYSQSNIWLLVGPATALLCAYYSAYLASLYRQAPSRRSQT